MNLQISTLFLKFMTPHCILRCVRWYNSTYLRFLKNEYLDFKLFLFCFLIISLPVQWLSYFLQNVFLHILASIVSCSDEWNTWMHRGVLLCGGCVAISVKGKFKTTCNVAVVGDWGGKCGFFFNSCQLWISIHLFAEGKELFSKNLRSPCLIGLMTRIVLFVLIRENLWFLMLL